MASTAVVNCSGLQVEDNCLFLLKSEGKFVKSNYLACASVMSDIYDVNRSLCSEFGMILFCNLFPLTDPIKLKAYSYALREWQTLKCAMGSYSFNYRSTDLPIHTKVSSY